MNIKLIQGTTIIASKKEVQCHEMSYFAGKTQNGLYLPGDRWAVQASSAHGNSCLAPKVRLSEKGQSVCPKWKVLQNPAGCHVSNEAWW